MPARSALSPRRGPEGFSCLDCLPQCEILLILLAHLIGFIFLSFCLLHSLQLSILELGLILLDIEVDRSFDSIGIAIIDDPVDELHDLRHVLGHSCQVVRVFHAKGPN